MQKDTIKLFDTLYHISKLYGHFSVKRVVHFICNLNMYLVKLDKCVKTYFCTFLKSYSDMYLLIVAVFLTSRLYFKKHN